MKDAFLKLYTRMQVLRGDCGQDRVEYALVVALIALAAVAGMQGLAGNINAAFQKVGSNLGTYIS
jgi:pilus assembly protein Flp/PilA